MLYVAKLYKSQFFLSASELGLPDFFLDAFTAINAIPQLGYIH